MLSGEKDRQLFRRGKQRNNIVIKSRSYILVYSFDFTVIRNGRVVFEKLFLGIVTRESVEQVFNVCLAIKLRRSSHTRSLSRLINGRSIKFAWRMYSKLAYSWENKYVTRLRAKFARKFYRMPRRTFQNVVSKPYWSLLLLLLHSLIKIRIHARVFLVERSMKRWN